MCVSVRVCVLGRGMSVGVCVRGKIHMFTGKNSRRVLPRYLANTNAEREAMMGEMGEWG